MVIIIIKKVGALRVVLHSNLKSVMQCAHFLERVCLIHCELFIADTITQSQELSYRRTTRLLIFVGYDALHFLFFTQFFFSTIVLL
jgi:hypothetical protein